MLAHLVGIRDLGQYWGMCNYKSRSQNYETDLVWNSVLPSQITKDHWFLFRNVRHCQHQYIRCLKDISGVICCKLALPIPIPHVCNEYYYQLGYLPEYVLTFLICLFITTNETITANASIKAPLPTRIRTKVSESVSSGKRSRS